MPKMIRKDWRNERIAGLPPVSDDEFEAAFSLNAHARLGHEERIAQMVSFVWGNALESDRSTYQSVCENLGIDTDLVSN